MADKNQEAIDEVLDTLTVRHVLELPTATLTVRRLLLTSSRMFGKEELDNVFLLRLALLRLLYVKTACLNFPFPGVYTVLMTFTVYLLHQKSSGFENRKGYLGGLWVLFVMCTVMVIDTTLYRTRDAALQFLVAQTGDLEAFIRYFVKGSNKSVY
ncbi:hypothetical protein V5O48_007622 [Marasmius crinis-equi]|uniref:Uncharacterized protein n=1 Tax=Marasmius crinis-equi TaxID=585013 RepID=A0ABR3FGM8_9AGAR